MSSFLRLEALRRKQKKYFKCISNSHISTSSFFNSFGIETTNTFIRVRSSLENHTRLQTKKKQEGKNTNLCGGTYLYGLYREVRI